MRHNTSLRITLDVVLLVFVLLGWWFAAIPVAVIGAWVFPRYAEIVIAGFLFDALFGIGRGLGLMGYVFTLGSAIILGAIAYLMVVVKNNS